MILQAEEIKDIIRKGVCPRIEKARKRAKKVNMHITGKAVTEFLEKLDDYETQAQKNLREKLVKSNRSAFSFILRPVDKVFTAKGGAIAYNLPQEQINSLRNQVSDLADGLDIKTYLKKIVKKKYIIDPNGLLFIDIDPFGMLETHVVPTSKILWYKNKGNKIEALIFDTGKKDLTQDEEVKFKAISEERLKEEKDKIYYRVIDDTSDRIFTMYNGEIEEVQGSSMNNWFGFVPAIILGDEKDPNEDIYESIVSDIVEDADSLLRLISTNNVHDLAHLYPRYWSYAQACTRCEGEGQIDVLVSEATEDTDAVYEKKVCPSCGGSGVKTRTNPSDEVVIPIPGDGDTVITPDIAGYVSPDLQTAKFYVEKINDDKDEMFKAMWGTTYEQSGKRETATGRWLDQQPVEDRLRDISSTFENFHRFMLMCYGIVILQDRNYKPSVSYGTRYILEGADDILKKYTESSEKNISEIVSLNLRNQYLEAEYQNDPVELAKQMKLARVEPFPTMKVNQVLTLEFIDEQDKKRKMYFGEWVNSLDEAKKTLMSEVQLKAELDKFINTKTLTT